MSVDLTFDDDQKLIADEVEKLCRDRADEATVKAAAGAFPRELWSVLGDAGFLALGAPGGEGGAQELLAALEPLGRAVFPGPIVDTVLALQLVDEPTRDGLIEGQRICSSGTGPLMPFAEQADLFLLIEDDGVYAAEKKGDVEPVQTLGGEPWGRVQLMRGERFVRSERALSLADLALSAYLTGAAQGLLAACAEHVGTRKQFGRAIGSFQAVAHPLADCHMALGAAQKLARAAAVLWDARDEQARGMAAAARISSRRAALNAAYTCHQKFGAIGITLEGPAHHVTRRIRQLASRAPAVSVHHESVLSHFGV